MIISPGHTAKINGENGDAKYIRFSRGRESYIFVPPTEVLFVKSADHYVKSLVLHDNLKEWVIRHSTLKEISALLCPHNFIRLNKFYLINRIQVSQIDILTKTIFLKDGFPIQLDHRISPFVLNLLIM